MTITLPLQPQEEAKLIALAQAKGLSTDALVREALAGLERKPRVTQHRCFPRHGELARLFFAQFEISGPDFVGGSCISRKKD